MAIKFKDGSTSHAGVVTGTYNIYYGDGDSVDYVRVWDADAGYEVNGPSWRSSYYGAHDSTVDSFDIDIYDGPYAHAFATYKAVKAADAARAGVDKSFHWLTEPRKGAKVTMTTPATRGKTAHIKAGMTGVIIWTGPSYGDRYGRGSDTARCGVRLDGSDEVVFGDTFRWTVDVDGDDASDWYKASEDAATAAVAREMAKVAGTAVVA